MLEDYVNRFSKLRMDVKPHWPDATYNRAPYKPLLLLTVIDLFQIGLITKNLIELTPDLGELFNIYWTRVMPFDRKSNLAMPFFHLQGEGFWHLVPAPGKRDIVKSGRRFSSVSLLKENVLGAKLDNELYNLLCVDEPRSILQTTLIQTYFAPDLQKVLIEQGTINNEAFYYSQSLLTEISPRKLNETTNDESEYQIAVRSQGFRRAVVTAYDHRCAFFGIRLITVDGHTAVDAAHIVPWSEHHNDAPSNGLALSKLCHWAFDEGLIGITQDYKILLSPQIKADHNIPGHLLSLEDKEIVKPEVEKLWPDLNALKWHHRNVFRRL